MWLKELQARAKALKLEPCHLLSPESGDLASVQQVIYLDEQVTIVVIYGQQVAKLDLLPTLFPDEDFADLPRNYLAAGTQT
jgi:hypothetical protein